MEGSECLVVLPFQEEIVNDTEYSEYNFEYPRFIGYLNNYGEVLEYSDPLGAGGHDCDRTTQFFEYYFRMPAHDSWLKQDKGVLAINLEDEEYFSKENSTFFKEQLEYNSRITQKYGKNNDVNVKLKRDLELFFYNCYQAQTFMDGFGQDCTIFNAYEFYQQCGCIEKSTGVKQAKYYWYKKGMMLDWYKTVMVQYMHYHLIERCKKGITTSDLRPNETFYNYLLNDFEIHQIPRMVFDNDKKMYVPYVCNEFLIPDSELRLQEEIQSIKRLVPLKERSKYYR